LNLILTSGLCTEESIVALAPELLIFALPVLTLTGFYAAAPQGVSSMLGALQAWMGKHNRTITIVICLVFGAFFLVRGLLEA
jgi:hypothetical protein